jgi:site-specific DNA-methyltransferase (adenine-specific)
VLVPEGRMCIVVGYLYLSRRKHGRHRVLPLNSDIIVSCLNIGFDYLSPIIWHKVININTEAKRPSYYLGRPGGLNSALRTRWSHPALPQAWKV